MHNATARLRHQQRQPVNYEPEDGQMSGSDMDGNDLHVPSPPDSPRRQPADLNKGEEVRIHPIINGMFCQPECHYIYL